MDPKIVLQEKTEDGHSIVIRYPSINDAQAMCDYINTLSKEQTFVRFQGETQSLEDEIKYLTNEIQKISDKRSVQLLFFLDNKLIGISGVDLNDKTEKHEGVLSISISSEYRGKGFGKKLMQTTLDQSISNLPDLKIITLAVFGKNKLAFEMYEHFGFKEYGRLPEGVLRRGEYDDHVLMYKKVK